MHRKRLAIAGLALGGGFVLSAGLAASACSSSSGNPGVGGFVDGGNDGTTVDAGSEQAQIAPEGGDGGGLMPFSYPADPGGGAFYVTISGESNALTGYPFPPDNFSSDSYMPDGWEFQILEYLVVVDKITLWSNPNQSATDQSQHGSAVAHLDGPFVVDLHKGGKIVGQGGYPELSTPIGVISNQNDNGNAPFDTTSGTTYGWGFSTVQATYDAYNVNLDDSEAADFAMMVQKGYSVFYRGNAVWKGNDPGNPYAPCTQTNAGAGEDAGLVTEGDAQVPTFVDGGYDFTKINGLTFAFALGFSTPTHYVNCQNMTGGGQPLPGEDYARGVAAAAKPVDDHAGDRPHGPPLLGELPGGHPGALGRHRVALHRLDGQPCPRQHRGLRRPGVPPMVRQDRDAAAVAQLRRPVLPAPRQRSDVLQHAERADRSQRHVHGHHRAGLHAGQLQVDPRLLRLHPVHAVDAGAPQLAGPLLHRPAVPGAGRRIVSHPTTREVEWTRLLHERGLRRTEPRIAVLRRLGAARAPLAHRDLVRMLAHLGFDRATLYRNLMDLVDAGLAIRRDIGHLWRFQLLSAEADGPPRAHFVCTECGAISPLPEEAVRVVRVRGTPRSLARREVEVEVRGRCDGCR